MINYFMINIFIDDYSMINIFINYCFMINHFVIQLTNKFPNMKIIRVDERFTSKMAFQSMIYNGFKKKQRQNKALLDEISATIMLQDYLTRKMI